MTRAHKILLASLLLLCVGMAAALIRLRNRAQDRLQEEATSAPAMGTAAGTPPTAVTLYVPNDLDGSLTAVERSIPLPQDANARAQVLLESLVEAFDAPGSTHPMRVSQGINEVYLLPAPAAAGQTKSDGELAVVDLTSALAAAQPSGIEPETLTIEAMLATLHANMPDITEVHFLVDGQPRETLAGHADMTRTYMASEANPEPNPQTSPSAAP